MTHEIIFLPGAAAELKQLRVIDQRRIRDEIEIQLQHQPTVESKNRKCLLGFSPSFEHEPPVWELRIGEFRVFYDMNAETQVVFVRAIRRKTQSKTTEDIA